MPYSSSQQAKPAQPKAGKPQPTSKPQPKSMTYHDAVDDSTISDEFLQQNSDDTEFWSDAKHGSNTKPESDTESSQTLAMSRLVSDQSRKKLKLTKSVNATDTQPTIPKTLATKPVPTAATVTPAPTAPAASSVPAQAPIAPSATTTTSTTSTPAPLLTKTQALEIVKKMAAVLKSDLCDAQIDAEMSKLIKTLNKGEGDKISIEQWAELSLKLKKLNNKLDNFWLPVRQGISSVHFIKLNLKNLECTSHYAWGKLARDELIMQFASEITRQSVDNPALLTTHTWTGALDISTPISFLSVGLDGSYQTAESVDEEGNFRTAQVKAAGVSVKVKGGIGNAKARVGGAYGGYVYCKTAKEHATHFFNELVEQNRSKPSVARLLSRRATLDSEGIHSYPNEITSFDAVQNDYLAKQKNFSQFFSILLSNNYSTQKTQQTNNVQEVNLPGKTQVIALVKAMTFVIGQEMSTSTAILTTINELVRFLSRIQGEQISSKEWDDLCVRLEKLLGEIALVDRSKVPGKDGEKASRNDFVRANIKNLAVTCRYASKKHLSINHYEEQYLKDHKHFSTSFATLLKMNYSSGKTPEEIADKKAEIFPAKVQLNAAKSKKIRPTDRTIMSGSGSVEGTLGAKADTVGDDLEGAEETSSVRLITPSLTLKLTGQLQRNSSTKLMPFCELLGHSLVKPTIKTKLGEKLDKGTAQLRDKVGEFWHSKDVLDQRKKITTELEKQQQQYRPINEDNIYSPDWAFETRKKKAKLDFLKQDIQQHIMYFEEYSKLHSPLGKTAIEEFHKKYNAETTDECLKNIALLNAYFFSQLRNLEQTSEVINLQKSLRQLEDSLHVTSIPHSTEYLEKHCFAKQNMSYWVDEKVGHLLYKTAFGFGNPGVDSITEALPIDLGVKITSRTPMGYYDAFRTGDFLTVEFSIGASLELNKLVLNSIQSYLADGGEKLGEFFEVGSFSAQGLYTLHFLKPNFPGQPRRFLYYDWKIQETLKVGLATPEIPVGHVNLKLAGSYVGSKRQLLSRTLSSDTILFYAWHYMHALNSGKTDLQGNMIEDSYSFRMEREDEEFFRDVFSKYAHDYKKRTKKGLLNELKSIEADFYKTVSQAEKKQYEQAKLKFLSQTQKFEQDKSEANYDETLKIFKEFLRALYPLWLRDKEGAGAYDDWEFDIE